MVAMRSFNASDDGTASSQQYAMIKAMLDGDGCCRLNFLAT